MDFDFVHLIQSAALVVIVLSCAVGIILQVFAWRHLKPGIPRFGHKDALFKKKELYYTEAGLVYIEMQKKAMYTIVVAFVTLLFLADAPLPDVLPSE